MHIIHDCLLCTVIHPSCLQISTRNLNRLQVNRFWLLVQLVGYVADIRCSLIILIIFLNSMLSCECVYLLLLWLLFYTPIKHFLRTLRCDRYLRVYILDGASGIYIRWCPIRLQKSNQIIKHQKQISPFVAGARTSISHIWLLFFFLLMFNDFSFFICYYRELH